MVHRHLKLLEMNWGADNLANVVDMRNQSASDTVIAFSSTCCCDEKEWSAPSNVSVILITSNQFRCGGRGKSRCDAPSGHWPLAFGITTILQGSGNDMMLTVSVDEIVANPCRLLLPWTSG
jgi:hypothetical protein